MPLRAVLGLVLVASALGGVLLAIDIAVEGDSPLLELLMGADLLVLVAAALIGFRRARSGLASDTPVQEEFTELKRAKQAAENASLAKSRYLANVSHEIRSPLNAIYGYAQLFERGDGVNAREAARVILRCSEHLTNLVEGLLDISQLEFGVLRVRTEEVRFGPFMDQIVSMMRPAALSKGLAFHYEPPLRAPDIVRLDPSRFRQVLINLLSNAIKFTDQGSVTLKVSYAGQIATFEVRDTGPGIPTEDHERIFERFEQGSVADHGDTGGRAKSGAGLGLAIARTLVEILGGRLELESEVGHGSCFRITTMLSEVAGRVALPVTARKPLGYKGPRREVLLVEDDADQRLFMQQLLSSLGFSVHAAASGEAAIALLDGAAPNLAILDISLPGISGWEVGATLRARFGEDIQILMLSANSEELHRPDFDTPAHDRFLVKPVEFETLADTIGELLRLVWEWEEPLPEPAPKQSPRVAFGESALPHVTRLQEYLRIGYARGIEAEVRALEEAAPDAGELVRRLYDCLDRYDLSGMARLLSERTEQ
jgi:signal transduction histidine kinase/DNA-binding response OmpR family regulator